LRYIDLSRLPLPNGWLVRANAAKEAVAGGDSPDGHAPVWRDLKLLLADLFHEKCWYCESPVTRDDNAVDHFRPKGRVKEAQQQHNGYSWLAFDHTNYRYSCTFCNSRRINVAGGTAGGKEDRFPLMNEATRVYAEGPCDAEEPMLLDPCDPFDWRLLGCKHENGLPCSAHTNDNEKRRAEESIDAFHLHHGPTCNARHAVAVDFVQDIDEAKQLHDTISNHPNSETAFKKKAKRILKAIAPNSPFSGDMHFLLRSQRSEAHPWIEDLLQA